MTNPQAENVKKQPIGLIAAIVGTGAFFLGRYVEKNGGVKPTIDDLKARRPVATVLKLVDRRQAEHRPGANDAEPAKLEGSLAA